MDRTITIIMTTYAPSGEGSVRADYAERTLESLFKHLKGASFRLHIADDGSADNTYISRMLRSAYVHWGFKSGWTNSNRHGIGASLNKALYSQQSKYWMYITDDWVLTEDLDVSQAIKLLDMFNYGFVRLGPIHPNLSATVKFNSDIGWWLELDSSKGGFVFATRPFIAKYSFYNDVGPFDEGLNAYETERLYSERVAQSNVKAAFLGTLSLYGPWTHIGAYEVGREAIHIT